MTAVNHIEGKRGLIYDLLADLTDEQLQEQAEYFAERARDEPDEEKAKLWILALASAEERIVRRQMTRLD